MSHFMCPVCGQETDEPKTIDRSDETTLCAENARLSEEIDKKNKALADEATRLWKTYGEGNKALRAELDAKTAEVEKLQEEVLRARYLLDQTQRLWIGIRGR